MLESIVSVKPNDKDTKIAEKFYICCEEECNLQFKTYLEFKKHRKYAHLLKGKYFTCEAPGCQKIYKQNQHLTRHMKQAHSSSSELKEPIKCTFQDCPKEFTSKHTLYKHVKRFHQNRIFKCNFCGKIFKKHQYLKCHEYEHTKIKPFNCTFEGCGKSFLFPSQIKRHLKTHASYDCAECSTSFSKWSLLVSHKKREHKKIIAATYGCPECGKHFTTRAIMKRHSLIHSPERKAYHCPQDDCSRFYYCEKNLRHHIRVFHNKIRVPCSHEGCQQTFANNSKMKAHLKIHESTYVPASLKKQKSPSQKERVAKKKKERKRKEHRLSGPPDNTNKSPTAKHRVVLTLSEDFNPKLEIPPYTVLKTRLPLKVR